jgi:hypothetical protein
VRYTGDVQTETIAAGREFVEQNLQAGGAGSICPCCDSQAVLRKRKIASTSARVLLEIYRYYCEDDDPRWAAYHRQQANSWWVHIPDFLSYHPERNFREACVRDREYSRLKLWGLVQPRRQTDGTERSGFYRMTASGLRFVRGEIRVPRWAWVFHDTALAFSDGRQSTYREMITITQALGDDFVYAEIIPPDYTHRDLPEIEAIGRRRMRRIRGNT